MPQHKERKQLRKELEHMLEFIEASSNIIAIKRANITVEYVTVDGITKTVTNNILDKNMETEI